MAHSLDADGRILAVSDEWLRVLGYERPDVIGRPLQEFLTPSAAERVPANMQILAQHGMLRDRPVQFTDSRGNIIDTLVSAAAIKDKSGQFCHTVSVLQDVTERKSTEAALLESTQFSQQVVNQAGEGIIVYDRNYRFVVWNPIMEALTGLPTSQVLGKHAPDIFPYLRELRIDRLWRRASEGERVRSGDIHFHIPQTGRQGWIKSTFGPHINASGDVIGVIEVVRDVTARRNSQEALQYRIDLEQLISGISTSFINLTSLEIDRGIDQALESLGRFVKAQRTFVLSIGDDGMLTTSHYWCSPGIDWPQARNQPVLLETVTWLREALNEPDRALRIDNPEQLCEHSQQDTRTWCCDTDIRSLAIQPLQCRGKSVGFVGFESVDDNRIWTHDHLILLKISGEMFVNALERKRAEDSLRSSEERLLHSQKMEAVGRLAGGVAHDFNNLLTAIQGYADLLRRQIDNPKLEGHALQITKATQRASALTQQLLAFSRRQVLRPQVVDVNKIVHEMEDMLQRLIGAQIDLRLKLTPTPVPIVADQSQISQVVMNLVVNARDAMPRGGILKLKTERIELDKAAANPIHLQAGSFALITVVDTGMGMDENILDHLFEPFFTTKEHGKGTGLGLATVYGIVEQNQGSIQVESKLGAGSTFRIYLPIAEEEAQPSRPQREVAEAQDGSATILLVEDEEQVRELIKHILEGAGYSVHEAADGSEALQVLERQGSSIDLLLTDIVMPKLGGLELAERAAEQFPELIILYMSGYTPDSLPQIGSLNNRNFMHKPFSPSELIAWVGQTIESAQEA